MTIWPSRPKRCAAIRSCVQNLAVHFVMMTERERSFASQFRSVWWRVRGTENRVEECDCLFEHYLSSL